MSLRHNFDRFLVHSSPVGSMPVGLKEGILGLVAGLEGFGCLHMPASLLHLQHHDPYSAPIIQPGPQE